ncbi:hypothetical protein ACJJTC_010323 [Scirpophaga incertulas]
MVHAGEPESLKRLHAIGFQLRFKSALHYVCASKARTMQINDWKTVTGRRYEWYRQAQTNNRLVKQKTIGQLLFRRRRSKCLRMYRWVHKLSTSVPKAGTGTHKTMARDG